MHAKIILTLASMLCVISLNVFAESKNVGQMTNEEYQKVRESSADYNDCLQESALNHAQSQPDIRVVADHAMKDCVVHLEELYQLLVAGGYPPEAMSSFVSSISNKGANNLIRNLMSYRASQSQ